MTIILGFDDQKIGEVTAFEITAETITRGIIAVGKWCRQNNVNVEDAEVLESGNVTILSFKRQNKKED